ncbi:Nuclear distribution protein nudF 1 [Penicillium chermesinum]|uniref:Nuclear distribution protein nudF 1 n=1 Tax=Penicillium chermesinum TaxID=63820 RepID=A0A9W9PHG4_9EURO|nr:Nuclear distribution protein nudF 1 [Penicillium chermesinum]KAJ5246888.1 Nuclear distribution protein nudF 1 [Penicillium chermesinum]KAJ6145144.1 Nuclear distribution protein nudF 1 [Penicillium chermesinum]
MGSVLTARQTDELHKAIIGYLAAANCSPSVASLREELGLQVEKFPDAAVQQYGGLLAKKWTSLLRFSRQIMDLESEVDCLKGELKASPAALKRKITDPANWLPKAPTYTLKSHRCGIECVAFHPTDPWVASGAGNGEIKIWDWEQGRLAKTIWAHSD